MLPSSGARGSLETGGSDSQRACPRAFRKASVLEARARSGDTEGDSRDRVFLALAEAVSVAPGFVTVYSWRCVAGQDPAFSLPSAVSVRTPGHKAVITGLL